MNGPKQDIAEFLSRETPLSTEEAIALVATPPDSGMGDYAVPCFPLAKTLKKNPAQIAAELAERFAPTARVRAVSAAGPYLNFRLDRPAFFADVLDDPAARLDDGAGETIVLDYGSPNIAKHLAYHHLRSTCIGYSLKRIFGHLGYRAVGINHLGDWGTTHGKLIAAVKRWGEGIDLDTDGVTKLNRLYVRFNAEGDEDEGREWFRRLEQGDEEAHALWRRCREISIAEHQQIFDLLGVDFDLIKGESDFVADSDATIAKVEAKGLAEISDGALVVMIPEEGVPPLFLRKADGATVYSTRDLAAAFDRWDTYGFERCLYVVDLGQSLYFRQLFTVLSMMEVPFADRMEHVGFGLVTFGGKKTGTRTGNVILLRDVLEEAVERIRAVIAEKNPDLPRKEDVARAVGTGAIVFAGLSTRRTKNVEFDWEDVLNFDGHTGPYVQYTHARCASILRKAGDSDAGDTGPTAAVDFGRLTLDEEWETAKLLDAFPERVRAAAREAEPAIVAQYLLTLCETFSRYYNQGNEDPAKKVITEDPEVSAARLALVEGVRAVLEKGLGLLGVRAPEEM